MSIFYEKTQNWENGYSDENGVFVKSQLGIKSTFNLLVKSQPNYIGKKSTFDLLVLSQPNHIGKKSTYDLMVSSQLILWNKSTDSSALVKYQQSTLILQ